MPSLPSKNASSPAAYALTIAGIGGYLVAFAVAMAAWWFVDSQRRVQDMADFGETAASELAHVAAEPMSRNDRVSLGLAAQRLLKRPEVSRVSVYTVDNQPFVVIGDEAASSAPAHIKQIIRQDAVIGDVSVTLDASRFGLPVLTMLARSWLLWLFGLALTVACCALADWRRSRPVVESESEPAPPPSAPEHHDDTYILVANLFQRQGVSVAFRENALRHAAAVASRVADLYAGESAELPGTGVLVTLGPSDSVERGFEAVCAALLLRRLCRGLRGEGNDTALFRYGLDLASGASAQSMAVVNDDSDDGEPAKRLTVSDVVLLSSLAPSGELIVGADAYDSVEESGRLIFEEVENTAASAIAAVSVPKGIVRGVAGEYDSLLRSQAEFIAHAISEELG